MPIPQIEVSIKVYFYDTDAGGVVHNVAYLRMIEQVRSDLAEEMGWSLGEMGGEGSVCPVVARTEIDYIRPARLGDTLIIRGSISKMEKVCFYFKAEVFREGSEEILCRSLQKMVTVNLKTGRPKALRSDWREKWGATK